MLSKVLLGVIATMGVAGYFYYSTTQARLQTLTENNAKLETAIQISEDSVQTLKDEAVKNAELNRQLQTKLQKAEAYSDNLRNKLQRLDLVQDALTNPEDLEGRMNGATAKLWRELMADTGNDADIPLPRWLQPDAGTGSESSDSSTKSTSTDSSSPETN